MELRAHPMQHCGHHAVLVYFVCGACGKENRHTYELTEVGKGS
uniref:CHUR protein n=1 Tax=Globodera pallida TaxID=36090 RepID=A0A183CTT7_GLOPA